MPDQITRLLDQIEWLDESSTDGPWHYMAGADTQSGWFDGYVYSERDGDNLTGEVSDHDAEFIALSRTALPAMAKALRAVLYLHPCLDLGDLHEPDYICASCVTINRVGGWEHTKYPCPTVRAITDALGADDD